MRLLLPSSLLITVFHSCTPAWGAIIPFEIVHPNPPFNTLQARAASLDVANNGNAQYIANITIGGTPARVLLDTGSSDLWVSFTGSQPTTQDLGKSLTLSYAVGSATGQARSATVQLGPYKVDNQAFLLVGNTNSFSMDIHRQGYDGLLGLGPNKGSVLYKKLKGHTGDTTLTNIFKQTKDTKDNYITVLLNRAADPFQKLDGQFTINEIVAEFTNVTQAPKLDLSTVNRLLASDQHWQALTDVNGIIGPDGNPIITKSIVPKAPKGQLVAVFDSGYTFSQVPRDVSDAIYGRVQGAVYDEKNQIWTLPCGQYLSAAVSFGGVKYPIHPFDLVDDNFRYTYPNGTSACIGAFQPITSAFSILGQYDMILGMSFLRNAYSLYNFGEWSNEDGSDPYIQLVSLTDTAVAKQDFISNRLAGNDSTGSSRWALLPKEQQQHSPVPPEEKKKKQQEKVLSRWPYIVLGCLVLVALIVGICIWKCCCNRKNKSNSAAARALKTKSQSQPNPFSSEPASTTYLPLDEPTIQAGGVYQAGGGKYSGSQYSFDSTYHNTTGGGNTQYPPGVHYPPTSPYPEPKSPVRSVHSFDTSQYPAAPPAIQYPPSPSHYPPSNSPPHYAAGH